MAGQDCDAVADVMQAADFRFLVERNADGILVLDANGVVLFANPAAEEAFGRRAADLVGTDIGVPVVAGETIEIAILRPGGSQIDAEMRVVATNWAGSPALLVSLRDISARKLMEDRLRQAQKMESIGRLTAGIAHDFNNLLTVIMGNLATMQREIDPAQTGPRFPRAAERAMEGARRAAALTQRLLAFARRQPLEPRPLDVNKLVTGMSDLLHRTLGEDLEVETVLSSDALYTLADPNQLEAAILNLAVNARDAMQAGGRLVIQTRPGEPANGDRVTPAGAHIEIRVRDDGTGMTPEVMAQAFEPFFTTKSMGRGTGLGLSQVFGFIKQSGGDVEIESAPGEGTTVILYLPRVASGEQQEDGAAGNSRSLAGGETILVVDDEEHVRRFSAETLRELGYRVLQAEHGEPALALLDQVPEIALLFTDVRLPGGMNGRELAEEARRRRPDLKILLTTGYAGDALVRGGRLEPGFQLLAKPFSHAGLAAKVRAVLHADSGARRVLVVEDEPMVRLTIVETLVEAGCHVVEVSTASEALAKFREFPDGIDAAIIDIGLPDGRGDRLVTRFRSAQPGMPILLSTGYDDTPVKEQFAGDQRLAVLEKPFDDAGLRRALRELGLALP